MRRVLLAVATVSLIAVLAVTSVLVVTLVAGPGLAQEAGSPVVEVLPGQQERPLPPVARGGGEAAAARQSGPLARTGIDAAELALLGSGLLLAGISIVVLVRRRVGTDL